MQAEKSKSRKNAKFQSEIENGIFVLLRRWIHYQNDYIVSIKLILKKTNRQRKGEKERFRPEGGWRFRLFIPPGRIQERAKNPCKPAFRKKYDFMHNTSNELSAMNCKCDRGIPDTLTISKGQRPPARQKGKHYSPSR